MKAWQIMTVVASALGLSCSQAATGPSGTPTPSVGPGNAGSSGGNAVGPSSGSPASSGGASSSGSGGGPTSGSGSPVTAASGGGGSGASVSGSASSGAGAADAAVNDPNTVTLTMGSFVVPAGKEVFMCQDFDNPFQGVDVAIGRSESDMTEGSHHLHVFYGADNPPSPTVSVCQNPFEFRSLLHVGGQPKVVTQYPAGMAAKLRGNLGLRLQSHYLNSGTTDLNASVVVKLTKVDPTTITKWVAELYFNRTNLTVPVGNGQTVSTTCTVPSTYGQISLISGLSHMHMRGVHFVASTSSGVSLVDTTVWDEPPIQTYDTPISLNPGDSISWTCTYNNNTGAPLVFGDSAQKNEMCIFLARFYSAPSGNDIECQSPTASSMGVVSNNVP
jgi:hypothetical protein